MICTTAECTRHCRGAACRSRRSAADTNRLPIKWYAPIASVAAVTAQPLAALPPYGCGVPFTGSDRHWHSQISGYSADRTDFQICHCDAPKGPWQSRAGSYDFADGFPVIRPSTARFPRRFAPRNDKSGAFAILTAVCTDCKCVAGSGMPLPYKGRCGRRGATKPTTCKALTTRKGHAASVRRQSRQRLRSERPVQGNSTVGGR